MYKKCALLLIVASCLALVAAYPMEQSWSQDQDYYPQPEDELVQVEDLYEPVIRHARSPHGSIVLSGSKDDYGRSASVQYNQNLYTSRDGRGTIDAYAQASRNFDYNRNDYGGGVQASWSF